MESGSVHQVPRASSMRFRWCHPERSEGVLLAAVVRRAAWRILEHAPDLVIATTEIAIEEMREHLGELADYYGLAEDVLHAAIEVLPVERYRETDYIAHVPEARSLIARRDPDDVHIVALAAMSTDFEGSSTWLAVSLT